MTEFDDTPQSNEISYQRDADYLPTTPEIAKKGVSDLATFFENVLTLEEPNLYIDLINESSIKNCFLGISPEARGSIYPEWYKNYADLLPDIDQMLIHSSDGNIQLINTAPEKYSIVNLTAIRRVMEYNPQYFSKDMQDDVLKTLQENLPLWEIPKSYEDEIRYGLLSGFPTQSAEKYAYMSYIRGELQNKLTDDEWDYFDDYYSGAIERTDEVYQHLAELIHKRLGNISVEEINEFLDVNRASSEKLEMGYVGGQGEEDAEYIKRLEEIYDESGVEDVMKDLEARLYGEQ